MYDQGNGRPPGAVVIRASNVASVILFGFLVVLWVLALLVSETGQPTLGGRIAAGLIFGILLAASIGGWWATNRTRRQLEIGRGVIVSRRGRKGKPFTLTAEPGDTLRILPRFTLYARLRAPRLMMLGRGGFVTLNGLSAARVGRVCQAQGWRFDGDPALAVRDVQDWLHSGLSVEAVQLIQTFGPFPAAVADGEPHTALEAAVFEDVGDKLGAAARANARNAYRRAVAAQRAFAGYATSADEAAARMAEAARIEGKAEGR